MPAPERDLFAWLSLGFTISTGVVIAIAALMAFTLQRARYLRDVAADLRFNSIQNYGAPPFPDGFQPEIAISNTSLSNSAENIRVKGNITFGHGNQVTAETCTDEIAPGRRQVVKLIFDKVDWANAIVLEEPLSQAIDANYDITLEYHSPRELVLFVVNPFRLGRVKYRRKLTGEFRWTMVLPDGAWTLSGQKFDSVYLAYD